MIFLQRAIIPLLSIQIYNGFCYLCAKRLKHIMMEYNIKEKLEWTVIFILEFGRKYGLTMKQAFNYLSRYKGIDFIDRHYGYVHTQSFSSMVDDIAEYCHRHGGALI